MPSDTPFVSSLVCIRKKDGSLRPCIDFRKLNAVTVPDHFPLPRIESVLERIGGCCYYSSLDMSSGYMQIPLDEESSYKCGVTTEEGTFRLNCLPFGLRNASSVFARIMTKVLEGLEDCCLAYINDVLIFTKSDDFGEHLQALRKVLERLRNFNLKLSPKKCAFGRREVEFFGRVIKKEGYRPAHGGLEKIKDFPAPKNLKEVSFVGMASFFRRFIPDFSKLAEPLTRLTKKDTTFKWSEEQDKSFKTLRDLLVKEPILAFPDCQMRSCMLPYVVFACNTSVHESTKETPSFMMHGRDPLFSI